MDIRRGIYKLSQGQNEAEIELSPPMSSNDYEVIITILSLDNSPEMFFEIVKNKTTNSFTAVLSGPAPDSDNYYINWVVIS